MTLKSLFFKLDILVDYELITYKLIILKRNEFTYL